MPTVAPQTEDWPADTQEGRDRDNLAFAGLVRLQAELEIAGPLVPTGLTRAEVRARYESLLAALVGPQPHDTTDVPF